MYSLHHLHLPHNKLEKKDFLFLAIFLRTFIFISLFTFLPGIIYKQFLFLGEQKAILIVCLFFFLYSFANLLFLPLLPFFYKYYGVRSGLIFSLVLTFLMLIFLQKDLYIFAGYLYGLLSSFWWVSYYILFLYLQKNKALGKSLGFQDLLTGVSASFSPLISSFLLKANPFYYYLFMFLFALVVFILILRIPKFKIKTNVSISLIFKEILRFRRDFVGFIGAGGEGMIFGVFWPLFLYLVFKDFVKLGGFVFLIGIFTSILSYLLGKFLDQIRKVGAVERVGVLAVNFSWLGKIIFQNPIFFAFLDLLRHLFHPLFYLPLSKVTFEHARTDKISHYVIFREVAFKIGNLLAIFSVVLILLLKLPFVTLFLFAAIFALMPLLVRNK